MSFIFLTGMLGVLFTMYDHVALVAVLLVVVVASVWVVCGGHRPPPPVSDLSETVVDRARRTMKSAQEARLRRRIAQLIGPKED